MTVCSIESSVPDWIIDHPQLLSVFQALGIDYCCGGKSLEFACRERHFDPRIVLSMLRQHLGVDRNQDAVSST